MCVYRGYQCLCVRELNNVPNKVQASVWQCQISSAYTHTSGRVGVGDGASVTVVGFAVLTISVGACSTMVKHSNSVDAHTGSVSITSLIALMRAVKAAIASLISTFVASYFTHSRNAAQAVHTL
jgi:hypothetical protein